MTAWMIGTIELLAADFAAAERSYLEQYRVLEKMGERSHLSTLAGQIGRLMCDQGRYEEGERFTFVCEESAASDDISSQILWRSGRARVCARRGDAETAESLAREAVSMAMRTDYVTLQADTYLDLGDVLQAIGRPDEAAPAFEEAVAAYRQKGIVPMAARAEAALNDLARDD